MANDFLQTTFAIPVMPDEAALLEECFTVATELSSDFAELPIDGMQTVKAYYTSRSEAFRITFSKKPEEEEPFAGFFDLWSDPGFLGFYADLIPSPFPSTGRSPLETGQPISGGSVTVQEQIVAALIPCECQRMEEIVGDLQIVAE